jgi:membrane associated rhomboid family serine protease
MDKARAGASSLLPRLAMWRAARAHHQHGTSHPSMMAPTQGAAASTGLLRRAAAAPGASSAAAALIARALHTTRAPSSPSSSLWGRLIRSSGASSDPLGPRVTATNALIAANLAVALASHLGIAPDAPAALARVNWRVRSGEWYRLLTAGFVHTGLIHLLVNTYALYALRDLERVFGGRRYLAIYLVSVVAGNWLALRQGPSLAIGCGASSGVCGVVGAYVAARVANRRLAPVTAATFSWVGQIVALNLVVQALNSGGGGGGVGGGGGTRIDQWGHLGGALGGAAAALALGPRLRWSTAGGRGLVDAPPLPLLLWRGGRVPPGW